MAAAVGEGGAVRTEKGVSRFVPHGTRCGASDSSRGRFWRFESHHHCQAGQGSLVAFIALGHIFALHPVAGKAVEGLQKMNEEGCTMKDTHQRAVTR